MKKFLIICVGLLTLQLAALAQTKTVTGTVLSGEDNLPVIGATVLNISAGNNVGTITDANGQFSIKASKGQTLNISFIGLEEQNIVLNDQSVLNVTLAPDAIKVDDVVVVGYGTRKKGTITGSVSTVSSGVIDAKPSASFDQALQGQVAGVQVITSSGEPNAASSVKIRGTSSMGASTAPLYIMDGVVISAGDFTALSSSDIESVSILKDASSTSIYGARAANGVIVITTKQGKFGEKATVKVRAQYGVSKLYNTNYKMMNTKQVLAFEEMVGIRNEANTTEQMLNTDTDWSKELYRLGQTQNYEVSYAGGSDKATFYVAGSYFKQSGIAPRSGLERFTFRTNNQTRINNWLKLGANLSVGYTNYQTTENTRESALNVATAALINKPYDSPYDADGNLVDRLGASERWNPLAAIASRPNTNNDLKVVGSFFIEVQPVKNLTIRSLFGMDGYDMRSSGKSLYAFEANQTDGGSASETFGRGYRMTMTNTAAYNLQTKSRHNVNFLLGQESIYYRAESFGAQNTGIYDDKLVHMGAGTVANMAVGGYSEGYSYLSVFGRAEYNYDYKYYVDLSVRGDGSSRFAAGNRWGTFWSVGLMWDMAKENFLKGNRVLTGAQISASAGTSGNSEIGYYDYMSWLNSGPKYDNIVGIAPGTQPGNPDLTWESTISYDLGLTLSFINRINFRADVYHKITNDMLMTVPVSMVTGYTSITQNVGKMSNTGVEIDVNGDIVSTKSGFVFNLGVNFAYNANKLLKLYDNADSYLQTGAGAKYEVGRSMSEFFMNRYAGVNPANGDALWYDKDGNVTNVALSDDAVFVDKSYVAPWNGGVTATFSYKGISLSAFFNWSADRYVLNNTRLFTENPTEKFVREFNQGVRLEQMWKKPGDITDIPRMDAVRPEFATDQYLEDASFLRLKNLTLSYDFPQRIVRKMHLQNLRIFAQGQNLFTITKFTGFDPEDNTNVTMGRYPTSRQYLFGIDISF